MKEAKTVWKSNYFFGNEVSEYGQEHGFIDYATLAKAFDAVLNNDICAATGWEYWEQVNGIIDNYDEIERLNDEMHDIELDLDDPIRDYDEDERRELEQRIEEIIDEISELEQEEEGDEIFQYYIISDQGADLLKDYTNEIVFYNEHLDMYVWGVTHWGTSWDYVLSDIKIELDDQKTA